MPKPPDTEKKYFGKIDAQKRRRIADEKKTKEQLEELKRLRCLHWHKCPECGFDMEQAAFKGTSILNCHHCGGAFLNSETLDELCGGESRIVETFLNIFKFK
jgi:hypothetical protein